MGGRKAGIVVHEVTWRILHPDRLRVLLEDYLATAQKRDFRHRNEVRDLKLEYSQTEASLARLMELVEPGSIDITAPAFRERMVALRFRRDELAAEVTKLVQRLSNSDPTITPAKIEPLASTLSKQLRQAVSDLGQV